MEKSMVDRGFELRYYKLSYRRKFIRTLWCIPWSIIALVGLYWMGKSNGFIIITAIVFGSTTTIQAIYNYRKWKGYIIGKRGK